MNRLIQSDKLLHFLVGIAIVAFVYPFSATIAIIASITIAFTKEYFDSLGFGTSDKYDALATIIGSCVMILYYWIIK